ncbi:MAG: acetate--CoA ligase [Acidobacteria bacterium]|nr:acetate--CoA ligase [Acidobacteriota bacterium]MBI3655993.1 acetate--CoA ligase [Acidobacteriota bacterium]
MADAKSGAGTDITSVLKEKRVFKPKAEFSGLAHIKNRAQYDRLYRKSIKDPEGFWGTLAEQELVWHKKWTKVLEWKYPFARWFVGGKINVSYNCVDRHLSSWRRNKAAIVWEGEPGDARVLTYQDLHREVCRFANVLKTLGVEKGDRVAIYMPMVPELPIAMLACARVGATHTVIFGGFSSEALKDRINDSQCKVVITADGGYRRGQTVPLKTNVDAALADAQSVQHVIVLRRTHEAIHFEPGRDHWWHEMMSASSNDCPPERLDSEHPLYILYTSGTTGKPKGVLHTTAGYLLGVTVTAKYVFDLKEEDTFWCTADIGWVTGHSYIVYGPLSNGATVVMYEGAPNYPEPDRFWHLIEKYRVTVFYTAPTAIRSFIRWGEQWPRRHDLSSLRLLGTVGEPINPEAWMWYHHVIGAGKCPIVDTWWQTETGMIMITPLPGVTPTKPGSCTLPFFGIDPLITNKEGRELPQNHGGLLALRRPWPAMFRTLYGDPERYRRQYWEEIPGVYFTGDGARCDKDGYYWMMGRVDDVINVSGHRLGTMEVESALVHHPSVAEAAVVGRPDEIKGQGIVAFVTLRGAVEPSADLREELRGHVTKEIGALARPDEIRFTDALPKTRSGKIMRRLLREVATSGGIVGDTTTLEDFSVLDRLRHQEEE